MPRDSGIRARYQVEEAASRGQERTLSITVGHWGGVEARPTRVFVWVGQRGYGVERLLTTGRVPRLLRAGRRRRHIAARGVSLSYLGNPLMTVGLLFLNLIRRSPTTEHVSGTRDTVGGS